jgi:hypothetical protein
MATFVSPVGPREPSTVGGGGRVAGGGVRAILPFKGSLGMISVR